MKKFDELSLEFLRDYIEQAAQHGRDPYNRIGTKDIDTWVILNNWFNVNIVPGQIK